MDRTALTPTQNRILDELIAISDLALRRRFDENLATGLRAQLERDLDPWADMLDLNDSRYVAKYPLHQIHLCEGLWHASEGKPFEWTVAMVRGRVAHEAIQLSITAPGIEPPLDLIDHAIEGIIESDGDRRAGGFLRTLSPIEIARLKGEANDSVVKFLSDWPPIETTWYPRVESPVRVSLCADRIVLSGKFDFALGRPRGTEARVLIVDFKTGGHYPQHPEELRFYALLETLRSGVPPFRIASYYMDSATFAVEDVTEDTLASAVRRTVDGVRKMIEIQAGRREPFLVPGSWCRYCPARQECDAGIKYLSESQPSFDDPD